MDDVKNEYDKLDKDLTRREILKDQPIIIFWRHVIGEQKRLCTFKEFPTLWNLIDNHIVHGFNSEDLQYYIGIFSMSIFTITMLTKGANIGVKAIRVITLLKSSAPSPSIILANFSVSS